MKKHLNIITFNILLIITPTIVAMEEIQNSNNSKELSQKIEKFCELFSLSPQDLLVLSLTTSSHQKFLKEIENSIKTTNNCFILRDGMFKAMQILADTPRENKKSRKEFKILCKAIDSRLVTLLDNSQKANDFYCHVLNCLSDDEEETNENSDNEEHSIITLYENQTLKNFNKYQQIKNFIYKNDQNKTQLEEIIRDQNSLMKWKILQIATLEEQLKQAKEEYIDLKEKNIAYEDERTAIYTACNLLNIKASNELLTIKKQKEKLEKRAHEISDLIKKLTEEKSQIKNSHSENIELKDSLENNIYISNKTIEIDKVYKELVKIKLELSNVTQYLEKANKKTDTLENITSYLDPYKLRGYLSSILWSK